MTLTLSLTLFILFIAALTKATLGFGESLLTIPLLTMIVGVQSAAPLGSLLAGTMTLLMVVNHWQNIDLQVTWRLLVAAVIGVPVGVWGLASLPARWSTIGLGIMLILVGGYHLVKPNVRPLAGTMWAYLFGFCSGVLGGAYNMASPPVLLYGATKQWTPDQFRITLQSFFLPVSILILVGHASAGLWTGQVLTHYLLSLPICVVALWIGNRLNRRINTDTFGKLLYAMLILLGTMLLI